MKTLKYILFILFLSGCSKITQEQIIEPIPLIEEIEIEEIEEAPLELAIKTLSEEILHGKKTEDLKSTLVFLDPVADEVVWIITYQTSDGTIFQWPTSYINFLDTGGIWFFEEDGDKIILHKNYTFMLIKWGDWIHEGWKPQIEIKPKEPKEPKELNAPTNKERS